jgi:hypothetical protein
MAYHKWSNPKLTLNDYRAILSCHVAQSSCFNRTVEEFFFLKTSNDATCYIFRLPHVNILVCTIVTNVVTNVVIKTHLWIRIKYPYSYSIKHYFICCLRLMVVCNLSFVTMMIFNRCVICD